jgi:hypothetical protein
MKHLFIYALILVALPMTVFADDSFLEPQESALLKPDPKVAGLKNYNTPGKDLGSYTKVVIGSITLYYAQDSKAKDISADEMTEINKDLRGALVDALSKHFDVVAKPGPDSMLMNVAVTNIKLKHKKRGLLGYTPIGLVATTAGNIAGKRLVIGHASLQGEFVDSVSGDELTIFQVDQVKNLDDKKQLSWKDVQLTLKDMADKAVQARFGD